MSIMGVYVVFGCSVCFNMEFGMVLVPALGEVHGHDVQGTGLYLYKPNNIPYIARSPSVNSNNSALL
jgi:hypothetical protein